MKQYSTYFFDLDGTLIKSNKLLLGVNEMVSYLKQEKKEVYLVTNNPVRSPKQLYNDLRAIGLSIYQEQIITPFIAVKHFLGKQKKPFSIYITGSTDLVNELLREDFPVIEKAEQTEGQIFVVLGMENTLTYKDLQEAFFILQKGAQLILLNSDLHCPSEEGLLLDTGSLANLFSGYTPLKEPIVIGKPAAPMQDVMKRLIKDPGETIIIGDSMKTDIAIGHALGVDTVLLTSEIATVEKNLVNDIEPTFRFDSILDFYTALRREVNYV
jgi:4-nitrophenyl phosphatase